MHQENKIVAMICATIILVFALMSSCEMHAHKYGHGTKGTLSPFED